MPKQPSPSAASVASLAACQQKLAVLQDRLARLEQSERELEATFQHAAIGIVYIGLPDFGIVRSNRAFCQMLGYSFEELQQLATCDLVHPNDLQTYEALRHELLSGRRAFFVQEKRFRRKDGSIVWARVTSSPEHDRDGSIRHLVKLVEDITAAKRIEEQLHETSMRLELATSTAQLGFWEWEPKTGRVYLSPGWKRQLGYEDDELKNSYEEFERRLHPGDLWRVREQLDRSLSQSQTAFNMEFRLLHKDGRYRWIWTRAQALFDEQGQVAKLLGTHLDITERKETEDRMRHLSQHDVLTGLPNRSLIYDFGQHFLAAAKRSDGRMAVLFCDLDRFKPINDTYGHAVGDKMLIAVAHRLRKSVREEDVVGRLGGDEFLVMLAVRNEADIEKAAHHLIENLRGPYLIDGLTLNTSHSIGVAVYPKDGSDIDTLVQHADAAMYHAKGIGRDRVEFFDPRYYK